MVTKFPLLVMNTFFSLLSRCISMWWSPELTSKKLKYSKPIVELTNRSILDKGKPCLRHALLRLVKSTHIWHLPFCCFIITTFSNHYRYITSWMNSPSNSLSISNEMTFYCSSLKFIFFYWSGKMMGIHLNSKKTYLDCCLACLMD